MGVYDRQIASAAAMIKKKGVKVALVYYSGGTFDPDTDTYSGQSVSCLTDIYAVITKFKKKYIDGKTVTKDDKLFLIAAKDVTVTLTKRGSIIDDNGDGNVWRIVDFELISPNEENILYKIQARK